MTATGTHPIRERGRSRFLAALLALLFALALATVGAGTATAQPDIGSGSAALGLHGCSAEFEGGDRRLGPETLSNTFPVGPQLVGYDRTGGLSTEEFLDRYWDPAAGPSGSWIYPPADGYVTDGAGEPIREVITVSAGATLDRYGSEFGTFLAPSGAGYAERSIPPSNLVGTPPEPCNYHAYLVVRPFDLYAGTIAPWFGQPGGGTQYQLDPALVPGVTGTLNVQWLLTAGYLVRVYPSIGQ